jgi:hypothetical protein
MAGIRRLFNSATDGMDESDFPSYTKRGNPYNRRRLQWDGSTYRDRESSMTNRERLAMMDYGCPHAEPIQGNREELFRYACQDSDDRSPWTCTFRNSVDRKECRWREESLKSMGIKP